MIDQKLRAALVAAAVMTAGTAHGATYTASHVIEDQTSYGTCTSAKAAACNANGRKTVENALGDTDGAFYSLGKGGYLTLGFDASRIAAGATLTLQEVTFGGASRGRHFEAVDVYSILGGLATFVGTVYNTALTNTVRVAQSFEYIRLVDATAREFSTTSSFDGFDVDSVKIAAVPGPAAGGLMLTALAGFGLMRRRKAAR